MMRKRVKQRPDLQAVPLLKHEPLYLGIDVGKMKHVAGFVSATLLERHERFEACPGLAFENSREGFRALLERIQSLAPLEHYFVLMEKTGHYHLALQQYLQECDLPVYTMHVQSRPLGMLKTDKRDALSLANTLYNQLQLGIQVADKTYLVRRAEPPTAAAAQLKGSYIMAAIGRLVHHSIILDMMNVESYRAETANQQHLPATRLKKSSAEPISSQENQGASTSENVYINGTQSARVIATDGTV